MKWLLIFALINSAAMAQTISAFVPKGNKEFGKLFVLSARRSGDRTGQ
jgi:protein involved in ribonucleotide reduction